MKRLVPFPRLALALLLMWLLLTGLSPGQLLLGSIVALAVSRTMLLLDPEPVHIRFSSAIPKLAFVVFRDILRSNLAVGRILLNIRVAGDGAPRSAFVHMPLDMRNRYALAVLAIIIAATPGTLWMQHDAQRNILLIHVLDLIDEDDWIRLMKNRYERLLMEIFE